MISKILIVIIALLFIVIGFNQDCYKCKYQALFGGLVYLLFIKAPNLGLVMTALFLITQFYANKMGNKNNSKRRR